MFCLFVCLPTGCVFILSIYASVLPPACLFYARLLVFLPSIYLSVVLCNRSFACLFISVDVCLQFSVYICACRPFQYSVYKCACLSSHSSVYVRLFVLLLFCFSACLLSVCLSVLPPCVCLFVLSPIRVSICLSCLLSLCLFVCCFICLLVGSSFVCLFICLLVYSVYLSACLSSIRQSVS